ncbi:hypothetical protein J8273_1514 [Carpediemonas membranifera]|uniref:Uncharacterized protein n=1 Tax=Carpediemonas membranifera TaxID=201153 RepID=A0A8J6C0E9_9EUKA|nr:hypothetical protein J8273_1514 [Carpediemonas membranifera]|eukprot:KAG9396516.1 hypothetical protein J8273_1514 [Carpediemonas membranifera]
MYVDEIAKNIPGCGLTVTPSTKQYESLLADMSLRRMTAQKVEVWAALVESTLAGYDNLPHLVFNMDETSIRPAEAIVYLASQKVEVLVLPPDCTPSSSPSTQTSTHSTQMLDPETSLPIATLDNPTQTFSRWLLMFDDRLNKLLLASTHSHFPAHGKSGLGCCLLTYPDMIAKLRDVYTPQADDILATAEDAIVAETQAPVLPTQLPVPVLLSLSPITPPEEVYTGKNC